MLSANIALIVAVLTLSFIMKAFSKIIGFVQTVAHVVRWIAQPLVTKRSNSFITIFIECECCESGTLTVMY